MLDDLPLEIIQLITQHLNKKDLSLLVCSSRRLCSVLQQSLYTEVVFCGHGKSRAVNLFLYAVTRNPTLATYVRFLGLGEWDTDEASRDHDGVEFDSELVGKLVYERTEYSEEEKSQWLIDLERDKCDAWVALLILQLKELRKINISWPTDPDYVLGMFRKVSLNKDPVFCHLEELNAAWWDSEGGAPTYFMNSFFKFPSVRKVGGYMLTECPKYEDEDEDEDEPQSESDNPKPDFLPPRCSNITHIDLAQTNAGEGMLDWIQACKALKSFRIIHGGGNVSYIDFNPRKIYESLVLQKLTLESVWVEADDGVFFDTDYDWMGTFVDFITLKTICASFPNLVGFDEGNIPVRKLHDVLPRSLETLYLLSLEEDESFPQAMEQLVDLAISKEFSRLVAIHFDFYRINKPENIAKREWARQKCEEAGVPLFTHCSDGGWFYACEKPTSWVFGTANEARLIGWY